MLLSRQSLIRRRLWIGISISLQFGFAVACQSEDADKASPSGATASDTELNEAENHDEIRTDFEYEKIQAVELPSSAQSPSEQASKTPLASDDGELPDDGMKEPSETQGAAGSAEEGANRPTPTSNAVLEPAHPGSAKRSSALLSNQAMRSVERPLPAVERPPGDWFYAKVIAATIYQKAHTGSNKLGYVRLGGAVERRGAPSKGGDCRGEWYAVQPQGFACSDEFTTDPDAPLIKASRFRADLSKPLPYAYGFVRATAPQYLKVPSKSEQLKSEFGLDDHLKWYSDNRQEVQRTELGANDVPLDKNGVAQFGLELPKDQLLSSQLDALSLLGGKDPQHRIPFWLQGERKIPNVAAFQVPDYAIFADRVHRKTGLSFVDAFATEDGGMQRGFAVTVDMRLIPITKVKPEPGSAFHGVEIKEPLTLPFAFVVSSAAETWKLIKSKDEARPWEVRLPRRAVLPLTGLAKIKGGKRYYQLRRDPTVWVKASDVGVVEEPPAWPEVAEKGERWIDVSIMQQTLVLYRGRKPEYATLTSTGRDGIKDPKTTLSTPLGSFRVQSKHIAAAMDSEENSSVAGGSHASSGTIPFTDEDAATVARIKAAVAAGKKLSNQDERRQKNIERGRHPEHGVTLRRGSSGFELRDVPWIQYFAAGYAIHGAYWHDVFGSMRSHGCINLSPIDARRVFLWTEPAVPEAWHGLNVRPAFGEGTAIEIRE